MSNYSNSNRKVVPAAAEALNKFKYEVASDVAVKKLFKNNFKPYITSYFIFLLTCFFIISFINSFALW